VSGLRDDPVLGYNFRITLLPASTALGSAVASITFSFASAWETPDGAFSECSGLEMSLDVQEFQEGGLNGTVLKFPTRVKNGNVTLKKGLTTSNELWEWFQGFLLGTGERRDGLITLMDAQRAPHTAWGFRRGLPVKWSGPQLNAGQNSVAIESIEIAHEGLYQTGTLSALANTLSSTAGAIAGLF
jgi:phage tail-like protein